MFLSGHVVAACPGQEIRVPGRNAGKPLLARGATARGIRASPPSTGGQANCEERAFAVDLGQPFWDG
jgi:hypothetical protein